MKKQHKLLTYAVALLLCMAVFSAYMQPDFMVRMAGQIWSC